MRPRGDTLVLLAMSLVPAVLVAADMALYPRSAFVIGAPAAAAGVLLVLGLAGLVTGHRGGSPSAGPSTAAKPRYPGLMIALTVAGLLVIGPRLALPAFAFVLARALGAGWPAAAVSAAVNAFLVEFLLVHTLGHPVPLWP